MCTIIYVNIKLKYKLKILMTYLKDLIFVTYMKFDFIKKKRFIVSYTRIIMICDHTCVYVCYNPLHWSKVKKKRMTIVI
jgi:hypothetical protein